MMGGYRPDVDGLRTVAVISVLLYHLGVPGIKGGFVGVDVFFVISGFLITRKITSDLMAGEFSFREFYLARIRRITPALVATVALTFIAGALTLAPGAFQDLSVTTLAALTSVSNILFWVTSGYFDAESSLKPLLHTWSLGVEEQFYLFWPIGLLLSFRHGGLRGMLAAVALLSLSSFIWSVFNLQRDPSATFFLLPFRVWELAVGGLLVFLPSPKRWPNALSELGLAGGLSLIAAAVVFYDRKTAFPATAALLPCIGAAMAIYFGEARFTSSVLTNRASVGIGKISYSIYLVHWPVIVIVKYVLMRELAGPEIAIAFLGCITLGYLMYALIEQPFRVRRSGHFAITPRTMLATIASAAAFVALPAVSAWSHDGWTWRLGERAKVVAGVREPRIFHTTYFGGRGCGLPRCVTSATAKRKVYVLGDSHARALFAGLKENFPDIDFVIFGPNACPLYTTRFGLHKDASSPACSTARKAALKEIAKGDAPVVMTHHWAARMASPHFEDSGNGPQLKISGIKGFTQFVGKELAGIKTLIGAQPLIIIGGIPRYSSPSSPLDCISRPLQRTSCDWSYMSVPYIAEQKKINAALALVLGDHATFLDPYAYLCEADRCRNFNTTGNPLYSDTTHLSVWGSQYTVARMKNDLARLMDKKLDADLSSSQVGR